MTKIIISKEKTLSVPYSGKAQENLAELQKKHMKKTGAFISIKSLASKALETATLK